MEDTSGPLLGILLLIATHDKRHEMISRHASLTGALPLSALTEFETDKEK